MRYLIFILFFSLPCTAGAAIAAPISQGETTIAKQAIPDGFAPKKQRFFERIAKNILQKRLKKSSAQPYGDNGRGRCIAGFVIGLVVFIASIPPLSLYLLIFFGFPFLITLLILSVTGLVLSISGLKKAQGWERTKTIRRLAIAGIIMNGLVFLLGLLVLRAVRD